MNMLATGRRGKASAAWSRRQLVVVVTAVALFAIAGIDSRLALVLSGVVIVSAVLLPLSAVPYLGVCALVAAYTFEMIRLAPSEGATGTVGKLVGAAVAAAWGLALLRGRIRVPTAKASLPVLAAGLFVAWAILAVIWAADADLAVTKATSFGMLLISAVFAATSIGTGLHMGRVAQLHVALGLCVAALSIGVAMTSEGVRVEYQPWGTEEEFVRTSGFAGDPNEFAAAQVLVLSVAIALAGSAASLAQRALAIGAAIVIAGSIITTASRGGLLALAVLAALWLASSRRALLWAVAAGVAIAGLAALGVFDAFVERIQDGWSDPRLLIWDVGLDLWRDHFAFGLGTGGFPDAFFANQFRSDLPIPSSTRPIVAHNIFLGIAVETGLVGLLLFLGMLAATCLALAGAARRALSEQVRSLARGYLFGLIGFLVSALFLSAELDKWLWLSVGLSAAFAQLTGGPPNGEES